MHRSAGRPSLLIGLFAVVVALGACSSADGGSDGDATDGTGSGIEQSGPVTTPPIRETVMSGSGADVALTLDGPHLAVLIDEGGLCEVGGCRRVLELLIDGRWHLGDQSGASTTGTFDAASLANLVRATDPESVVLGPFAGECPTAFDGSERSYLVFSPDRPTDAVLDLASCREQLDASSPLIVALDLLVADTVG